MSCNNCYNSSCTSTCSCPQQIKGTCVFYQGANLDCLDVTKGDNYDSILVTLNDLICNLNPPSGIATVVTGCSSITVTNPSDNVYNVCLSSATQTQINDNTSNIAALSACVDAGVLDIISNDGSVTITVDTPSTGCGRIIDLSVPTPSGTPVYDGIVESNNDKSTYTNTPGTKVLKASTFNSFVTDSLLSNGDEIKFRLSGQITGDGSDVDTVTIQLFNGSTALSISDKEIKGFDLTNRQSWIAEGVITVTDVVNGDGLYSLTFFSNSLANGGFANPNSNTKVLINEDISGIDYDNLIVKVIYDHKSTTTDTSNFARQLMIEVRKKI
jgi:hypothetical protein